MQHGKINPLRDVERLQAQGNQLERKLATLREAATDLLLIYQMTGDHKHSLPHGNPGDCVACKTRAALADTEEGK